MSSLGERAGILKGPWMWLSSQHWPYIQVELVNLGKQFQQMLGEPLATWLLWLGHRREWYHLFGDEIEWLASVTTCPSFRQMLQNARWVMQGLPNQTHPWWKGLTPPSTSCGRMRKSSQILWINGIPIMSWHNWWDNWARNVQRHGWRVFYWSYPRCRFEQRPIHHFWIPDCYSCTLCGVPPP